MLRLGVRGPPRWLPSHQPPRPNKDAEAGMPHWSDEETENPLYADERNFYKVESGPRTALKSTACSMPATISTRLVSCSRKKSNVGRG